MSTRLILVRHAQAEGNVAREFHGWTDSGITEVGRLQAQRAAQALKDVHIDVLYSSSMKRAIQTAEYIAAVKRLPIIRADKLKEINGGEWEGVKFEELSKRWPHEYDTWENKPHLHRMPNGESMEEFQKRLISEINSIIRNNMGRTICIVTHGTAIRALLCHFRSCTLEEMLNIPWFDNTSITIVDYENDKFTVVAEGDDSHLEMELSTIRNQDWWPEYIKRFEKRKQKKT